MKHPYYSKELTACKCGCGLWKLDQALEEKLRLLSLYLPFVPVIVSARRCEKHNAAVGGKDNSTHLWGGPIDFAVHNSKERFQLLHAAIAVGFNRIGLGKTFIHLDVGQSPDYPLGVTWLYSKRSKKK